MPELRYKTRAMSNPKGKPRVYFCCHQQDFGIYFESISDEILRKQNCAIWYTDDGDIERSEEYLDDLNQMQLFVVPVTRALLCTENPALKIEIPFALKNHIPVLPLMQGNGLEEIFNQKCGELQFLDKNNRDATAISYEEKLEKYLSSVLIGDELAEKIRAAFDAYVFLSYRKKDRKYAKELMSLIHKNDFCRDIAIWYDEYLVPGENFNDSIKMALEKSDLFVLTVTPNLVNEDNYIRKVEYPIAREEGKAILPVEVVPTDRKSLSECFEEIEECTDAYNAQALSTALFEKFKRIAIEKNDDNPEHNFFIGLAYLSGVDVEIDFERAAALIESAANAGLIPAVEKLVSMYEHGLGVEKNYYDKINWQIEELELKQERFETVSTIENGVDVLNTGILLGDTAKDVNFLDQAEGFYEEADAFCDRLIEQFPDEAVNWTDWKILILNRLSLLMNQKKEYRKSLSYAEQVVDRYENLSIKENHRMALFYNNLGVMHSNCENYKSAKEYLLKGIATLEACVENDDSLKIALARAYHTCANVEVRRFMPTANAEAADYYEKAIELYRVINEECENQFQDELAVAVSDRAWFITKEDSQEKAVEELEEACSIIRNYMVLYPKMSLYGTLGNTLNLIGKTYIQQEDMSKAKKYIKEALDCYEWGGIPEFRNLYKFDKAVANNNMGVVSLGENNYQEALNYFSKAAKLYEQLDRENHEGTIALLYYNYSLCYYHIGEYELADENLDKSCKLYKKLTSQDDERNAVYWQEYAKVTAHKADIRLKQKQYLSSAVYCIKSFGLIIRNAWKGVR